MGDNKLQRFSSNVDKGIETFSPEFSPEMHFTENTYNVTQGIKHGIGPRFGISPIPGHSHTDDTATEPVGIMQSEASAGTYATRIRERTKFLGISSFAYPKYVEDTDGGYDLASRSDTKTHFYIGIIKTIATANIFDFVLQGGLVPSHSSFLFYKSDIAYPLLPRSYNVAQSPYFLVTSAIDAVYEVEDTNFSKISSMSVKTRVNKYAWFCGLRNPNSTGDGTNTADLGGMISPEAPMGTFDTSSPRDIVFYNIYNASTGTGDVFSLAHIYVYAEERPQSGARGDSVSYTNNYNLNSRYSGTSFDGDAATSLIARDDAVTPAYADVERILVNDPLLSSKTDYTIFFAAIKKPLAKLIVSGQASSQGTIDSYVDLKTASLPPGDASTYQDGQDSNAYYTEDAGHRKSTCFKRWPNFVRGTAAAKDSASSYDGYTHVTLGDANSGILRKNTVYEFCFSVYNKALDFETNVGSPAKIQTGSDDYVAISFFRDEKSGANWLQRCPASEANQAQTAKYYSYRVIDIITVLASGYTVSYPQLNYSELRVYYREEGSYEWLPALFIDAAKYYYYPNHHVLWACQSPIAGLPGGQTGGFNDYSTIPDDKYIDVLTFRDRVFWLSKRQVTWSYRKNPFCYAGRNSVAVPTGEFRGMIAHAYPGQSEQRSRIIVFGSKETYVGRFTGEPELATIVVSPDTIGQFPVDGSDFYVDTWTSFTSFSGRSAVVANGLLYYWGEKGIFVDSGAALPERISRDIEPDIHELYDPNLIEEIHAHYFDKTKEIYWFYPPSRDNTITDAVIFNTQTGGWSLARFDMKIDSMQDVPVTNTNADRDTNGLRTVASIRKDSGETIQRAFYFDIRNRAGDMRPETEWLVSTITAPSTTTRRLALAGGYDTTNYASVAVGDKIAIQQGADYTNDSTVTDMVAVISALDQGGSGTIDITLPAGGVLPAAALDTDKYLPIWIDRHNQFPYVIETNYWTPNGIDYWGFWHYFHMLFKIALLTSDTAPELTLQYRTPISSALVSNLLTLADNSDGHYQILTQLLSQGQSFEGQSLKWTISGNHFAHNWVLQYLGVDIDPHHGHGGLQHFEG